MKAFTRDIYGGPEVLKLEEVEKPIPKDDEVLVKVCANSANPADWHILRGKPFFARLTFGLFKPKYHIAGSDFSGIVDAVGKTVTNFKIGDRVFGDILRGGAFAEYISVPATVSAHMPKDSKFSEMACVPIAGITALQALIKHGKLLKGETVLINGSTGGVGHFAVQIAKAYGAMVTAVCSSRNMDFVKSLGADQVVAYDKENIHEYIQQHDLVVDVHGNLSLEDFKRLGRRGIVVGFTNMGHLISFQLKRSVTKYPIGQFTVEANRKDLEILASFIEQGKIKVHIDKTYSYRAIPEAISYIESMRTRGKVAVVWDDL